MPTVVIEDVNFHRPTQIGSPVFEPGTMSGGGTIFVTLGNAGTDPELITKLTIGGIALSDLTNLRSSIP